MAHGTAKALIGLMVGGAYWQAVVFLTGTAEPWDSRSFLLTYGISIALAGLLGFAFPKSAWLWGLTITLAQMPVMILNSKAGPLMFVGLFLLLFLSIIPVGLAVLMAELRSMIVRRKKDAPAK